jgi:hypothetical protein
MGPLPPVSESYRGHNLKPVSLAKPLIRTKSLTSYFSAAGLGLLAGLVAYVCWRLGALPEFFPRFALQSSTADTVELLTSAPLAAVVIATGSILIATVLNRFGLRRSWSYLLFGVAVACSA